MYLTDNSAADVQYQEAEVVFIAANRGISSFGLVAHGRPSASNCPPTSSCLGTPLTDTVSLVGVKHGHVVGVGGTATDGQQSPDAGYPAAGEVDGVECGAGGGPCSQGQDGEVRLDIVGGGLVVRVGTEHHQVPITGS